jgi:hypothetical protein
MWEQSYPLRLCLGQTLVLMQMTFLNNERKVGGLVLSRISCICFNLYVLGSKPRDKDFELICSKHLIYSQFLLECNFDLLPSFPNI